MRYTKINTCDTINTFGGVMVSLWTQGCPHGCLGCFNPDTHDKNGGSSFTEDDKFEILELLESKYVRGLSILGGEPFLPENEVGVLELAKSVKDRFPDKIIAVWTGYTFERLNEDLILNDIDYIVDGRFVQDLHDKNLKLKGSSNQRIWKNIENNWEVIG